MSTVRVGLDQHVARHDPTHTGRGLHSRAVLTLLLLGAFVWSLLSVDWSVPLFHPGGGAAILEMAKSLVRPELSADILSLALTSSWRTLCYAVAGISLALFIAFPLGVLASGVLARTAPGRVAATVTFRGLLGFLRAIHELVWAWLFVAAIGLSPFAAILALALPYGGILGRIFAEMLVDVPAAPLKALRASGASELKVLFYGRLPLVWAHMLSYSMYRFECAIRSATIMSFVGLGGLGYQIQLSLQDLRYSEAWTFTLVLIGIVAAVDAWSAALRKRLVV